MARRVLIAGNWKLNKTPTEALELVSELRRLLAPVRNVDLVVAPPYTALYPVGKKLEDSNIKLSSQDIFYENSGAFTGTISGPMLKDSGCDYAIVAHSERRQFFGETLETSNKRVKAALAAGLIPIFCIGESLDEREAGNTMKIVGEQLEAGIAGLSKEELALIVVAYEPVWAIGTGKVATPEQAQEVHAMIRERIRAHDMEIADNMRILYGGSMKPGNAAELLALPDVDGGLIGGASLKAEDFAAIAKAS